MSDLKVNYILCLLCCLALVYQNCKAASVSWTPDVFHFTSSAHLLKSKVWSSTVTVSANGPFYTQQTAGNFRLNITAYGNFTFFYGVSDCISVTANTIQTTSILNGINFAKFGNFVNHPHIDYGYEVSFPDLFTVSVKKVANTSSYTSSFLMTFTSINKAFDSSIHAMKINTTMLNCAPPLTVGNWNDHKRWTSNTVPTAKDNVTIPIGSGIIQLSSDVTVGSLTINDGTLIGHSTSCPDGWSIDTISSDG